MFDFLEKKSLRIVIIAVASCAGCASQTTKTNPQVSSPNSGTVLGKVVEAAPSDHYNAETGSRFEQPSASPDNALPTYPAELLAQRLPPVSIQIRIVVDGEGRVSESMPITAATTENKPFVGSSVTAVKGWKFSPLIKVTPGGGTTTIHDDSGSMQTFEGHAESLPFHQDYVFVFSQKGGRADVKSDSQSPVSN